MTGISPLPATGVRPNARRAAAADTVTQVNPQPTLSRTAELPRVGPPTSGPTRLERLVNTTFTDRPLTPERVAAAAGTDNTDHKVANRRDSRGAR